MHKVVFGLLALVVAGCAANPATGGSHFSIVSSAQERQIGDNTAQQTIQQYGLYKPESTLTGYVTELCRKAWAVTETAAEPVQCLFLDSEEFNAWATPGYINVYRGLLPYMQNEAQLVAVLGHEAGHVTARHVGQQITAGMVGGLLATAFGLYVGANTESDTTAQLAYSLAGAGVGVGLASYSRVQELQADTLGQRYMERMGYDKRESVSMVGAMLAKENYDKQVMAAFNEGVVPNAGLLGQLYASHPASPGRQEQAAKVAGGWPDGGLTLPAGVTPATTRDDPQGRARFHQQIDGLTYGPQRGFGVAGRNILYLPKQRVVLPFPNGFVLQFAGGDQKKNMTFWRVAHTTSFVEGRIAIVPFKAGMNVAFALRDTFGIKGELKRVALKASNAPSMAEAYTGVGVDKKPYRMVAISLPHTESLVVAVFQFKDEAQRTREQDALVSALQHTRFYSEAAARKIQPLHIRTFKASVGDSVANTARTLPQGALQESWLRGMNGLGPDEELRAGTWYKTVFDPNI